MPDGGAISVEAVVAPVDRAGGRSRWFSWTARRGRGPAGAYGAVGAASEGLWRTGRLRIGGEVELWGGSDRGLGGGARLRLRAVRGRLSGLFLDLGAKSDGHWPGRPAERGVFFRVGGHLGPLRQLDPRIRGGSPLAGG